MTTITLTDGVYPVLPLRDMVVFPHVVVPLFVGRDKSVAALDNAIAFNKPILLVAQTDAMMDTPHTGDLYTVGTLATVLQMIKLPDGTVKILVEGKKRARVKEWVQNDQFFEAHTEIMSDINDREDEIEALSRSVRISFGEYTQLNKQTNPEVMVAIEKILNSKELADIVTTHLNVKTEEKQKLLEQPSLAERLELLLRLMKKEIEVLQVENKIRKRVQKQMEKSNREYYLNEQMKAIQKELGDDNELNIKELEQKIKNAGMPKTVVEKAMSELKRLKAMSGMSTESGLIRNYLDWLITLPWQHKTKLQTDLTEAKRILDEDHYGLDEVKERILEFLAVQNRTKSVKGSILCLVGPPGVGKTSLGQSIARATGRTFIRAALGGVSDEAEIRGHSRTYVGSVPGKIIQNMKKAKSINPLFLLDEIDKLDSNHRGDPASALLEVLDPEQNKTFNDHYLEVDYDLSHVMFITTANSLNMQRPLLDRMEIIHLSGYTEHEKIEIAKCHLIKKQLELAGLKAEELIITDDSLLEIIRRYTRESGVRNLDREIAKIARKVVKKLQIDKLESITITPENLKTYLGNPKYRFGIAEQEDQIGMVTGLAWTELGGELLPIEVVTMPGKGQTILTGRMGDVMKESVEAAKSFIRSRSHQFGIPAEVFEKTDIHIHAPEGAIPKDGPSAGVGMITAMVSALTGIPVRKDVAMTGEITLRGLVFPIGGLKEKLLAALRGGIKTVLIPEENKPDLDKIPDEIKQNLELIPVSRAEQVLEIALTKKLSPLSEKE